MNKQLCPLCKGEGYVAPAKKTIQQRNKLMIKRLITFGYSIREIAKILGYKSHSQVQAVLKEMGDNTLTKYSNQNWWIGKKDGPGRWMTKEEIKLNK